MIQIRHQPRPESFVWDLVAKLDLCHKYQWDISQSTWLLLYGISLDLMQSRRIDALQKQCLVVMIFQESSIFQQQICSPNAHWKALHSDHAVANGWMLLECSCALCSLKSWGLWGCWQSIEAEIRRCPRSVASRLWAPSSRQYLPPLSIWIDFTIPAGICLFPGYVGLTKWHHPHRPWR